MPRILTRKRERWARGRNTTLKGKPLRNNIATGERYASRLDRLSIMMVEEVRKEMLALFTSDISQRFFAMDESVSSKAGRVMSKLESKYEGLFAKSGKAYAEQMVKDTGNASKSALHSSLEKLSGGLSIKTETITKEMSEVIKATVIDNVGLIKTIPESFLSNVRGDVMRSITQPSPDGLSGLIAQLDAKLDANAKKIRNKAKHLALDQTRKTYNNFNKSRMQAVGITHFEWVHSGGGQNPRTHHKNVLDGKVFSFKDLPIIEKKTGERGIPGQAINCKCTMKPVINFSDETD